MTTEISLVTNCDDWEGIYINGKICIQDHSLSAEDVLIKLDKLGIINFYKYECSSEWLCNIGRYPENIQDVEAE